MADFLSSSLADVFDKTIIPKSTEICRFIGFPLWFNYAKVEIIYDG
jgi:hypothetical protein